MKVETITVTVARKHNLGNYENVDLTLSATAYPESNEDFAVSVRMIRDAILSQLEEMKAEFDKRENARDEKIRKEAERLVDEADTDS